MEMRHTAEFKQEAAWGALTSGVSRKQVAAGFGIGFSTEAKSGILNNVKKTLE